MDTTDQFLLDEDSDHGGNDAVRSDEASGDEIETDAVRLAQRQKQIAFGKNTQAYQNYIKVVPRHMRKLRGKDAHPATPDINVKASKRCWAGIVRKWRRGLHAYDNIRDVLQQQEQQQTVTPPAKGQQQHKQGTPQQQQQQRHQQQGTPRQQQQRTPHYQQQRTPSQQQQQQQRTPHNHQQRTPNQQHQHTPHQQQQHTPSYQKKPRAPPQRQTPQQQQGAQVHLQSHVRRHGSRQGGQSGQQAVRSTPQRSPPQHGQRGSGGSPWGSSTRQTYGSRPEDTPGRPGSTLRSPSGASEATPRAAAFQAGEWGSSVRSADRGRIPEELRAEPKGEAGTDVRKLTPSKRQHYGRSSFAHAEEDAGGDGRGPGQRDTPSKRSRASEQQGKQQGVPVHVDAKGQEAGGAGGANTMVSPLAGAAAGPSRTSWADQVDDAFGDWMD